MRRRGLIRCNQIHTCTLKSVALLSAAALAARSSSATPSLSPPSMSYSLPLRRRGRRRPVPPPQSPLEVRRQPVVRRPRSLRLHLRPDHLLNTHVKALQRQIPSDAAYLGLPSLARHLAVAAARPGGVRSGELLVLRRVLTKSSAPVAIVTAHAPALVRQRWQLRRPGPGARWRSAFHLLVRPFERRHSKHPSAPAQNRRVDAVRRGPGQGRRQDVDRGLECALRTLRSRAPRTSLGRPRSVDLILLAVSSVDRPADFQPAGDRRRMAARARSLAAVPVAPSGRGKRVVLHRLDHAAGVHAAR